MKQKTKDKIKKEIKSLGFDTTDEHLVKAFEDAFMTGALFGGMDEEVHQEAIEHFKDEL